MEDSIFLGVLNPENGCAMSVDLPLEEAIKTLVGAVMRSSDFKPDLDCLGWYMDNKFTIPVTSELLTLIGEEIVWYPVTRL